MFVLNFQRVLIGIIASFTMGVLSVAAIKLRMIAPLPPNLFGGWFASVARRQPFHSGQVSPINHEMAVAVPVLYAIGVTLALLYFLVCTAFGLKQRSPITALGFGLCTNLLSWLLMFPAMEYGWFGAHSPTGTRLFLSSLVTHCFYGVGLWLGASLLSSSATHYL